MRAAFAADEGASAHLVVADLDDDLTITGTDGHHLERVRRLRPGERVTATDGGGRWCTYEVAHRRRRELALRRAGDLVVEPAPATRIALAFAPTKGGQPDRVVQHATELGIDRIHPLETERGVVRWDPPRRARALERLERVAREAVSQSFRSRLPEIGPVLTIDALAARDGVVLAQRGGARPPELSGDAWTLVVGPEGGLSASETAALAHRPRLGLGDLVLRAETAALAGCAILTTLREGSAPMR